MAHIDDGGGGRFVSVLPRTRKKDAWSRDWVTRNRPGWSEVTRVPARRKDDAPDVLPAFEAPLPSSAGYRAVWVHSSAKQLNTPFGAPPASSGPMRPWKTWPPGSVGPSAA